MYASNDEGKSVTDANMIADVRAVVLLLRSSLLDRPSE